MTGTPPTKAPPTVTVELGEGTDVHLKAGAHSWQADEPESSGGSDTGPNPYEMLLGALGSCTALTVRMYARHKQMPVESVSISYSFTRELAKDCPECDEDDDTRLDVIRADVTIRGDLDEAQQDRLRQIVSRCPVHRTLEGGPRMFETVTFAD